MPETVKPDGDPVPLLDLFAFVGCPLYGDWEYVLWIPSIDISWIVNKTRVPRFGGLKNG